MKSKFGISLFLLFFISTSAVAQIRVPRMEDLPEDVRKQLLDAQQAIGTIQQGNMPRSLADRLPEGQQRDFAITMGINRLFTDINANRLVMPDRETRSRGAGQHNSPSILIPQELSSNLNALEEEFLRQGKKAIDETYSTKGVSAPRFWSTLARVISLSGAWEDAERTYQRAFSLVKKAGCEETLVAFDITADYVGFLISSGRLDEALDLLDQAEKVIRARSAAAGADKTGGLSSLTAMLQRIGGLQQSSSNETQLAVRMILGDFLTLRSDIFTLLGRRAEAETLLREALQLGPRSYGHVTLKLAEILLHQPDKGEEAEKLLRLSAASGMSWLFSPNVQGPYDMADIKIANLYAKSLLKQGKPADAESVIKNIQNKIGNAILDDGSYTSRWLNNESDDILTKSQLLQGRFDDARQASARAMASSDMLDRISGYPAVDKRRSIVEDHLRLYQQPGNVRFTITESLFQAIQKAQTGTAQYALNPLYERFAIGSGALSELIRARQDLVRKQQARLSRDLINLTKKSKDPADITSLTSSETLKIQADDQAQLEAIDRQIAAKDPRFYSFTATTSSSLADTQRSLTSDEALLSYFIGEETAWIVVVRSGTAHAYKVSSRPDELRDRIRSLRDGVSLDGGSPTVFPARKAYDLYRDLLAPAEDELAGVKHLYVVPDRSFAHLPLTVLLKTKPENSFVNPDETAKLKGLPWLVRSYSMSVLPSIGSLRQLRLIAAARGVEQSFIGIGDPSLQGKSSGERVRAVEHVQFRSGVADVRQVGALVPLPETGDELRAMAQFFSPAMSKLLLGAAATERAVKLEQLSRYRVLSFATHGLLPGELVGQKEPGLILSPPEVPSVEDDGVLTSSEIAQLSLNADWTILSACNTAAGSGGATDESLGGLAKAFLYAGARSLLVSHWKVASEATVALTTATVKYSMMPGKTRADAHRQAMLEMIDSGEALNAHPSVWASFSLVGAAR